MPSSEVDEVLQYAHELGHFPSWRQIRKRLSIQSDRVGPIRKEAFALWEGPLNPNHKHTPNRKAPIIVGVTAAEQPVNPEELWDRAIRSSRAYLDMHARKRKQSITFPEEPFALVCFGDTHTGSYGTDYAALKRDAEIVAGTDGMYALFGGDATNNWIVGRLQALERDELLSQQESWFLFLDWLDMIQDKLVAVVLGNHDNWSTKVSGFNPIAEHLRDALVLFDPQEIRFRVECGELSQEWCVRHKWKGSSVFNPTHGVETTWQRGDAAFDVGVGFHTHDGTLVRPFFRHRRKRFAVQLGAYKLVDGYGRELGFPSVVSTGCVAMIGTPGGIVEWECDLERAADRLEYLREREGVS